jgi:uncharacterized membrane protein
VLPQPRAGSTILAFLFNTTILALAINVGASAL